MKMTDKSVKGSTRDGGGSGGGDGSDGDGGGGGGVTGGSRSDMPSVPSFESDASVGGCGGDLHWLLPNIAEAIEILEGATAQEIQSKVEELTSVKYSSTDLTSGLENGTQLGLFEVRREFSLNHRYLDSDFALGPERELVSLVKKRLREECGLAEGARVRKSNTKSFRRNLTQVETGRGEKSRQKMCDRCKKKVNVTAGNNSDAESYSSASIKSLKSERSKRTGKRHARQEESPSKRKKEVSPSPQECIARTGHHQSDYPAKSKLLVETGLLRKEPPNLMFT